jgi:DNA-binding IclR family transcriptional regulator
MSNSIQTVDRVLQMLLAFDTDRRELSVSDFAQLLKVHKSTASRLAATLVARGFLERAPDGKLFRLGPELGRLGMLASGGRDLVAMARGPMERLAAATGETVNLAVLDGHEVVNIAQADGQHIIGVGNWTGRRTKLHCTSNGKVLLAFAGGEVGPGSLERFTSRTITDRKALRTSLEEVRACGWASNIGELEEGLNSVGVPVFDAGGRCRAALTVAGPVYRVAPERLPELAQLCSQTAREIGASLPSAGNARAVQPRRS